jgi:hypothetical protein
MSRAWIARIAPIAPSLVLLLCCARVQAQDEALDPPAPEDAADTPPAPRTDPPAAPPPAPEPSAPAPENYAAPPDGARYPSPPPAQRYEGQVGTEGGTYEDEYGSARDGDRADRDSAGDGGGFTMPGFSIRIDPFNWLLEGRLGLELEVVVWKFISVELVPVFVANTEPPAFNFSGRDDPISQHSNGLGPISGASLGAGFWLSGAPLRGYVLRAILTDYNYTYEAADSAGVFDKVSHADRRFIVEIGSQSRFSAFTIGGGIGLGYELNQAQRCVVNSGSSFVDTATSGCPDDDELLILADRDGSSVANLNGSFHPIYISIRLSLGVSFD